MSFFKLKVSYSLKLIIRVVTGSKILTRRSWAW